jgi:hypothetical protein
LYFGNTVGPELQKWDPVFRTAAACRSTKSMLGRKKVRVGHYQVEAMACL